MKKLLVCIYFLLPIICFSQELEEKTLSNKDFESLTNLKFNYSFSDNVAFVQIIKNMNEVFNNGNCVANYTVAKVIEPFKGAFVSGQTFEVYGKQYLEHASEGSFRLMFVRHAESHDDYNSCDIQHFKNILEVRVECCSIIENPELFLITRDFNLKESKNFLIKAEPIFEELRKLSQENSNKLLKH